MTENPYYIVMRKNIIFSKDVVEYIVRAHHKKMNLPLVSVGQMKRLVKSSKNFVFLIIYNILLPHLPK